MAALAEDVIQLKQEVLRTAVRAPGLRTTIASRMGVLQAIFQSGHMNEPDSSALQVEDKRLRAEQLDQASSGAAESALAPAVAGPGAGAGSQYVAAPAQCAHVT